MTTPEYWKGEFDYQREEVLHRLEVQNGLGQGALKSMMLVNGGAIISLLTFIGNKAALSNACAVKVSMGMFCAGLFFALLAYFGAYFSQADFMMVAAYKVDNAQAQAIGNPAVMVPPVHEKRGTACLWGSITCVLLSLALFGVGAAFALGGIL